MTDEVVRELERRVSDLEDAVAMLIPQSEPQSDPTGFFAYVARLRAKRQGGEHAEG